MSVDLAQWQRETAALIDGGSYSGDDDALRMIARSEHLDVVREIVRSWRELRIRTCCPLTAALLEQRDLFRDAVRDAVRGGASPYREELAMTFLSHVIDRFDDDELVAVAAFEEEMIRANHV